MSREAEIGLVKASMDGLSLTALGGWAIGYLPAVATVLTLVWTILRIVETLKRLGWLFNDPEEVPPPADPGPFDPTAL